MYPITILLLILAAIATLRNINKIVAWAKNFCNQAELASPLVQLYRDLDQFEVEILHNHLQAKTVHELMNNHSIALAELARQLSDFIDPQSQILAIEQALKEAHGQENQQRRALQS